MTRCGCGPAAVSRSRRFSREHRRRSRPTCPPAARSRSAARRSTRRSPRASSSCASRRRPRCRTSARSASPRPSPTARGELTVIDDAALQARRAAEGQARQGDRRAARARSSTARSRPSRPSSARRSPAAPVLELTVTGHDRSHRMHRRTTTRTFRQMTVTDIAQEDGRRARREGRRRSPTCPAAPPRSAIRSARPTGQYLSRLVRRHGGELDVAGGALHIIDPAKTKRAGRRADVRREPPALPPAREQRRPGRRASTFAAGTQEASRRSTRPAPLKASTTVENAQVDGDVSGAKVLLADAPRLDRRRGGRAQAKAAAIQHRPRARAGDGGRRRRPEAAGRRVRRRSRASASASAARTGSSRPSTATARAATRRG